MNIPNTFPIPVYWTEDDDGRVVFDREGMIKDLEDMIDELEQQLEQKGGSDE